MLFSPLSYIYLNVYNKKLERAGEGKGGQMERDDVAWELARPEFMTCFCHFTVMPLGQIS